MIQGGGELSIHVLSSPLLWAKTWMGVMEGAIQCICMQSACGSLVVRGTYRE